MLKVCLNGDRPSSDWRTPVTPSQLAAAAESAISSGAFMVHVHPRGASGRESLRADDIVAACRAIRERVPTRISVSTRDDIVDNAESKSALIAEWPGADDGGPDCASVNWHEEGAEAVAAALVGKGIGVEAGIFTPEAAEEFVRSGWAERVERVLVEVIRGYTPSTGGEGQREKEVGEEEATRVAQDVLAALGRVRVPIVVHGEQGWAWSVLRWARAAGYNTRIGLEDTTVLPTGREAANNAELVRAALDVPTFGRRGDGSSRSPPPDGMYSRINLVLCSCVALARLRTS